MSKTKFWHSENQRKWHDYVDENPLFGPRRPSQGRMYAVIDGVLTEYTECHAPTAESDDYSPDYDDTVFLGYGEYACSDLNIQTYMRKHPEVRTRDEEWPEVINA